MTKKEKDLFDTMVLKICHDIRRKMVPLSEKSGIQYVMVPLGDVLSEIRTFTNSIENKEQHD
jgi:hypothetical protein